MKFSELPSSSDRNSIHVSSPAGNDKSLSREDSSSSLSSLASLSTSVSNSPITTTRVASPPISPTHSTTTIAPTSPLNLQIQDDSAPKKLDKRSQEMKDRRKTSFLTLSKNPLRTASQTNMAKLLKDPISKSTSISVARGQSIKAELDTVITCTDLFDAAKKGEVQQAVALRKKGMGINGVDANGWTALHHAAANNQRGMVEYLIKEGIKIEIQDLQGMTVMNAVVNHVLIVNFRHWTEHV